MFLLCRRYMRTDEDAEEMMLNGYLKIFQSIYQFDYVDDPSTLAWVKKVMINECLMHLRKKNMFSLFADIPFDSADHAESVLEKLDADEIFRLIIELPMGYRTIFNLFVIEGMTHKDISITLGIKEGTSKSQLSKARSMLKHLLEQKEIRYAGQKTK